MPSTLIAGFADPELGLRARLLAAIPDTSPLRPDLDDLLDRVRGFHEQELLAALGDLQTLWQGQQAQDQDNGPSTPSSPTTIPTTATSRKRWRLLGQPRPGQQPPRHGPPAHPRQPRTRRKRVLSASRHERPLTCCSPPPLPPDPTSATPTTPEQPAAPETAPVSYTAGLPPGPGASEQSSSRRGSGPLPRLPATGTSMGMNVFLRALQDEREAWRRQPYSPEAGPPRRPSMAP